MQTRHDTKPSSLTAIPHPPRLPLIGNLIQLRGDGIVKKVWELDESYGPFFELRLPGEKILFASSHELVNELCDEQRFKKAVGGVLKEVRRFAGDGLFTAYNYEPSWQQAHNILLPGFGMKQMKEYVLQMQQIANQLLFKWASNGKSIHVTDDFTRLTLDTIASCGFDYQFNSFKKKELHPFLDAMIRCLVDSVAEVKKTSLQKYFGFKAKQQFEADRALMFQLVDDIIKERILNQEKYTNHTDFLSMMTNGVDKKSNSKLSAENIRFQLITFLIAGHETTSGMLSFAMHFLLENKSIYKKAKEESMRVLGEDPDFKISLKEVGELKYITQILKETLRLYPTAAIFGRNAEEDTILGGKYQIRKGERILVVVGKLHRDPKIWENPELFDPERFAAGNIGKIPDNAYRPFGTGPRICIGQHFAMVEAAMALALILKHFDLERIGDPTLQIKETLTIKPDNLRLQAKLVLPLPSDL